MNQKQVTSKGVYEQRLPDGSLYGQIGPRDWKRFEDTARYIHHDAESVLDVGCFCGDWLHYVLKHRPSIRNHLGIDVAQSRIDEAKRLYPELNVKAAFAEQLDMPSASFDVVTCLEVLEHIPDWLSVFNSLFDIARKQVLITVPYREQIQYMVCVNCGKPTPLYGHLRSYCEDSFPQVSGWSLNFTKIRDRGQQGSFVRKIYRFFRPHYPWLLVNYRRIS